MHDPVVVMGMSRSGTTLVAEMVHKGGTPMFSGDLDPQYDRGIKYERPLCHDINLQIFGKEGDDKGMGTIWSLWKLPLQSISTTNLKKLEAEVGSAPWGFKDPRTTLTYAKWCEVFPGGARIYVYRDHAEVVRHRLYTGEPLRKRLKKMRRAVEAWAEYNSSLIDNLEADRQAGRPAVLVRYEELMVQDDLVRLMSEAVGIPLFDARNPKLRRNKVTGFKDAFLCRAASLGYEGRLKTLYEKLGALRLKSSASA